MNHKILFLLILNALATNAYSDEREDKIRNYIGNYNGDYSPANLERIMADAAAHGVSAAEIDAAMGFQSGTAQGAFNTVTPVPAAAAPAPVASPVYVAAVDYNSYYSAPVASAPVVDDRTEKIKSYINNFGGNYSPENLYKIKMDAAANGVSAAEIDAAMGFPAGTAEAAMKNAVAPSASTAATVVNNYVPYSPNLSTDQAKTIADKYKNEFGYYPSTDTLTTMGYFLSGNHPMTITELVDSIKKVPIDEKFSNNYKNLLWAGIDPQILNGLSSVSLEKLNMQAILNADEPNTALRYAKLQLLDNKVKSSAISVMAEGGTTVATAGNYIVTQNDSGRLAIIIVDKAGNKLDGAGMSSESILAVAYAWGLSFDPNFKTSLNSLADQLDKQGLKYLPGSLYPGTGSDAGVNLRDIALGGTGSPNTLGDMTHAKWQDSIAQGFFGASAQDPVSYSSKVRASNVNYILDSLNVDPKNKSAMSNYLAPQKTATGVRNYAVVTLDAMSNLNGAWFNTAAEAQNYSSKNGGGVYDLQSGLPNSDLDPEKYQAALNIKYPQLDKLVNKNSNAKVVPSSYNKVPEVIAKQTYLKNEASKIITISSGVSATASKSVAIKSDLQGVSNPKTCAFNLAGDLELKKSANQVSKSLNDKISNEEKKLTTACSIAKTDTSGVKAATFLSEYTNKLAEISKRAVRDEIENGETFKKNLAFKKDKLETNTFLNPGMKNAIELNAKIVDAKRLADKAEIYQKNSEKINKAFADYKNKPSVKKDFSASLANLPAPSAAGRAPASFTAAALPVETTLSDYAEMAKKDKSLQPSEDDSIFKQINKAYMRNYDRLK